MRRALEENLQQIQVEDRLGDDVLGAGLHFPIQPAKLFIHIRRPGIGSHADQHGRLRAHGVPTDIEAVVEIVDNVDQPDGVHVEYCGGVGIEAHARRIAGDADEVAHAGRMGAQQFRLDAQNVAVAAAEMIGGLDSGLLLNELAGASAFPSG